MEGMGVVYEPTEEQDQQQPVSPEKPPKNVEVENAAPVEEANDPSEETQPASEDQQPPAAPVNAGGKLFVGGVSWETTEESLRAHFEKYGTLSDAALMKDKFTQQPRGFGFVTFEDASVIEAVLADTHLLDGRNVEVKRAVPRDKAPGPINQDNRGGYRGGRGNYHANYAQNDRGNSNDGQAGFENKKIFVGGLAPSVTDQDFKEYFGKYGEIVDAVVMIDRDTQRSRGFGFVTFAADVAVKSVMGEEHELHGKQVEIKRAEPKESRGGFRGNRRNNNGDDRNGARNYGYGQGPQYGYGQQGAYPPRGVYGYGQQQGAYPPRGAYGYPAYGYPQGAYGYAGYGYGAYGYPGYGYPMNAYGAQAVTEGADSKEGSTEGEEDRNGNADPSANTAQGDAAAGQQGYSNYRQQQQQQQQPGGQGQSRSDRYRPY